MEDPAIPQWGAQLLEDCSVRFSLWAPACLRIVVDIEGHEHELVHTGSVWLELITRVARAGSRYRYRLPDGLSVPDPASRFQPEDIDGPSEVIDHDAYRWVHTEWSGRPWHTAVVYELHVGAFTAEGTFDAAVSRLA